MMDVPRKSITLLLADDANSIRSAIRHILETEPAIELIGAAVNFPQALEMCAELKPTVLLLDLHMPGEQLDTEHVKIKLLDCAESVLIMSVWNDEESRALASHYGCTTFLDKAQLGTELVPAIMAAAG
jgi:two-component system, NarL family, response regulator NreC